VGFHPLDLLIILAIGLLIMGPKTIQAISRNAGKTVGQAKGAKDKLLAELPMEELEKVRSTVSRIPMSPQQAVQMLLTPEQEKKQSEKDGSGSEQGAKQEAPVTGEPRENAAGGQ
jgi:Sec-independent protein translocase protein TatA